MSADASPPHASALLFDHQKTSAAALLDALNSGGFRASASIGSVTSLDSQSAQKSAAPLDSQWKTAKPSGTREKAEKLQVVKSKGKEDAYTVKADARNSFRVRVSDAGYMVVLTWRESPGKWPERYVCYLSKTEWKKAQRGNLSAFVALVLAKLDERKATEKGDAAKLDALADRVRAVGE